MKKIKNAKLTLAAFWVNCPYCNEDIPEPISGSLLWKDGDEKANPVMPCPYCKMESVIPVYSLDVKLIRKKEN